MCRVGSVWHPSSRPDSPQLEKPSDRAMTRAVIHSTTLAAQGRRHGTSAIMRSKTFHAQDGAVTSEYTFGLTQTRLATTNSLSELCGTRDLGEREPVCFKAQGFQAPNVECRTSVMARASFRVYEIQDAQLNVTASKLPQRILRAEGGVSPESTRNYKR